MNNSQIINERIKSLIKGEEKLKQRIEIIHYYMEEIRNNCPHEIVLQYGNHHPHKIANLSHCICPTCQKKIDIYSSHEIKDSIFKDSKIIDLTTLDYNEKIHSKIADYIFSNYELFFKEDIPHSILAEQLLQELTTKEKTKNKS